IRWLWGVSYTDLGPFRAIRTTSLRSLRMDDNTYGWTVQMQIRAARCGLRAVEVPVDYGRRRAGKSKISGTVRGVAKAATKILSTVAQEALWPTRLSACGSAVVGVFAKFPQPGRAKTRLIPALSADGAAALHDQMVRHTLDRVGELLKHREVDARVWTAGSDPETFAQHFRTDLPCAAQSEGDLGQKMQAAFTHMLREADAALLIGTDCPDISSGLLSMALEGLQSADVVLGPATDGGYYLVGLRRPAPSFFEDIEWSTSTVLAKTLERASALGLSVQLLPMLSDVDEPQDLPVWSRVRDTLSPPDETPALSVIVPTLNEQSRIGGLVDALRQLGVEVIVADGGSDDGTRSTAAAHGARVIIAPRGRGPQLNAGALLARGHSLLFLHADTTLPRNFAAIVKRTLQDSSVALGAFRFELDRKGTLLGGIELAVKLRCRLFKTPYGDQALFMRSEVFRQLGGFASISLMEDLDLARRARKLGRIVVVGEAAITSARRWETAGLVRMTAINQACVMGFAMGVSPQRLAAWRNRLSGIRPENARPPTPGAHQIVSDGSSAPNAARANCMADSELDVRK
ncbi:MAG: TIGR04283 family arsenosugar biosynthesis glycosyltransferase, partial [Phycisphaerae bacterium]|nr:TIGR04283 family arsenosugar biosynthesis glycosyltransferase [Phycisphaerae bacterium]